MSLCIGNEVSNTTAIIMLLEPQKEIVGVQGSEPNPILKWGSLITLLGRIMIAHHIGNGT